MLIALAAPGLVVVYGPARAGKSRTAYEAVRNAGGDARVLVPEDADGLAVVLRHADRLAAVAGEPLVLTQDLAALRIAEALHHRRVGFDIREEDCAEEVS